MNIKNITLALTLSVFSAGIFAHHLNTMTLKEKIHTLYNNQTIPEVVRKQIHHNQHDQMLVESIRDGASFYDNKKKIGLKFHEHKEYKNFHIFFVELLGKGLESDIKCTKTPYDEIEISIKDSSNVTYRFSVPPDKFSITEKGNDYQCNYISQFATKFMIYVQYPSEAKK